MEKSAGTPNRIQSVPDWAWAPISSAVLLLVPGTLGMLTGMPLLFPSLAPTAVLQVSHPERQSSGVYSVVLGHFIGFASGALTVWIFGLVYDPAVASSGGLTWARVFASMLALALATLAEIILRARHPAAAATTLLVALGSFKPNLHDASVVAIGFVVIAFAGEVTRRLRLPSSCSASG